MDVADAVHVDAGARAVEVVFPRVGFGWEPAPGDGGFAEALVPVG